MSDYPTCAKCGDVIRDGGTYVGELSHQEEAHAYRRYVEDNLERIDRGGWTPVCYHEFLSSEERDTYSQEHSRGEGEWWECSGCASYVEESNEETTNQED